MSLTVALLSLTSIASVMTLLTSIRNAPEGHEDENGFHLSNAGKPGKSVVIRVKVSTQPFAA